MKKTLLRALDLFIIANLLGEIGYSAFMVFVALKPEGVSGPLFSAVLEIPPQLVVFRRLYALEFWLCVGVTFVYFGLKDKIYGTKLWTRSPSH